ncbi:Ldh family oxidoreductase [Corynebacterium tapiri]|uniref:Ldh family oxidoreductase n=1 Tax=Corynebacterium tapiri TaxID=1448266 RepID=A0A5C4U4Y0_9CORY|nr:Ldh family oxidoreductase [Corynebacterium tapiri]TNL98722.1 Ldh family oxidoreductase [Corynebacterium tapiri]
MKVTAQTLYETFHAALARHGMSDAQARSSAAVFVDAELQGKSSHGTFHLIDYLAALDKGAINGKAKPKVHLAGSVVHVDADGGLSQFAVDQAMQQVVTTTREQGVAVCAISNTYTTGELGWYPRAFARHGLVSMTTTNSPALVALGSDGQRVVGTNPTAFGVPGAMVMDQAVSETAYLNVRQHAARNEELPEGWAVDKHGHPTTDAQAAVDGAMLPFGGKKGANLALMSEVLALMAGGTSSLEVTENSADGGQPRVSMFILCLDPESFGGAQLVQDHLAQLSADHGVYIPGRSRMNAARPREVDVDDDVWEKLYA